MPVLVEELLTLYAHRGDGGALPRVRPYRDYLAWLAAQDRDAALAAWREALAGLEEGTRVAPHQPDRQASVPEQVTVSLSKELTSALIGQGRRHGLTLNTMIQGAWGILLGRLTGRDDVVFGVTVAGRPPELSGVESMVGLFINTLPLRLRLPPAKPLLELLTELQDSQSRLIAHQHVGLAEVQRLAGLGELFDTLMVFENYPVDRERLTGNGSGLRLADLSGYDATHYPLSLAAIPGDQLRLRLNYWPDVFDRDSVEALGARLVRLLEGAVSGPDRAIGSLELLGAPERQRILRDWNATSRAVPTATLPELFAAQALRTPDAAAVEYEGETLSYGALDAASNRVAHHLRGLGVGPEVVVGLCVERSLDMVIGLVGILKAGGAYLPLDPEYPADRLSFMLRDARAPVLVTQSRLLGRLPADMASAPAQNGSQHPTRTLLPDRVPGPRCRHDRACARECARQRPASAAPRLRDLHLGLDRNAKRRRGQLMAGSPIWRRCRSSGSRSRLRPASCSSPRSASMRRCGRLRRRCQRGVAGIDRAGSAARRRLGAAASCLLCEPCDVAASAAERAFV